MVSKNALWRTCRWNLHEVGEGDMFGRSAKGTSAESLEIFFNTPIARLSEEEPKLEAGARNNRDFAIQLVPKLRTVSATEGLNYSDYLATSLKASHAERLGDKV
jgi:hypothetical protein